jgi:4-alpha-glucanotransferase
MRGAKIALGVDRLVLQIHDASFPSEPDEDLGRGSPYTRGAERFLEWAAGLGFDAIQFGPRGMTSPGNPSPYDATIFSRNPLDLPLLKFAGQGRLSRATWESIRRSLPPPVGGVVPYPRVYAAYLRALAEIAATATPADRASAREFLTAGESWLVPDALYQALSREHGSYSWHEWHRGAAAPQAALDRDLFDPPPGQERAAADRLGELRARYEREIEDYALIQWLLAEEHRALRDRLSRLGLALYGDLQVGLSFQDTWARRRVFLRGYRLGAPPSRTNPQGQPWGYAVLDPAQFGTAATPGPALVLVRERIARVLAECDGLRIDHPHGWVDPWVYRSDDPDPFHAVQNGGRLFSSPEVPALAQFAIARPDQIDRDELPNADGRVRQLDDGQVRRYSILVDEIVSQQQAAGRRTEMACEVLSTLPYPVGRVMERHGIGRFRVTQKIDLANPADVYRIENAQPQDWIMLGTHDTPPIWRLADEWQGSERARNWGQYLAGLLAAPADRAALADKIAGDAGQLVQACFAALLASRARNVVVFFPDLFGLTARYNEPGVVSDANWSLRVPADFEAQFDRERRRGRALDVNACAKLAMQAK